MTPTYPGYVPGPPAGPFRRQREVLTGMGRSHLFEGGSGLDLLDRVRAADGLASRLDLDLPVVFLTGRAGEADRVRSFARGAQRSPK